MSFNYINKNICFSEDPKNIQKHQNLSIMWFQILVNSMPTQVLISILIVLAKAVKSAIGVAALSVHTVPTVSKKLVSILAKSVRFWKLFNDWVWQNQWRLRHCWYNQANLNPKSEQDAANGFGRDNHHLAAYRQRWRPDWSCWKSRRHWQYPRYRDH